ncbi:BTB/POZ domain-containing protein 6-B-like [Anopheles darlingi]|nr:BTB/POZ domain-containing protein 6-B-like [Anopheles darlingi]
MDVSTAEASSSKTVAAASTGPADTSAPEGHQSTQFAMFDTGSTMKSRRAQLVNNPFLADVKFLVGESRTPIYGHKVLLATASEYFYVLLCGNFVESQMREISLEQVDPEEFLHLLRYIYCDEFEITFENIQTLFNLACRFMVTDLHVAVRRFLEGSLNQKNALQIMQINRLFAFSSIDDACLRIISNNPLFFFNNEDFTMIDNETLGTIFRCRRINCTDDQLAGALDVWMQNNTASEEDGRLLHDLVKTGKRSYDCFKLHLFGNRQVLPGEDIGDFCFTIDSSTRISLYGIGLFVQSSAAVVNFDVKVYEYETEIGNDQYEYENKHSGVVNVADLFFEELRLVPHSKYRIAVDVAPPFYSQAFLLQYPNTHHTSIKLRISGPMSGVHPVGLAYLYCKELPDNE